MERIQKIVGAVLLSMWMAVGVDAITLNGNAEVLSENPSLATESLRDAGGYGGYSITALDRNTPGAVLGGYFDTEWVSGANNNSFQAHRLILQASAKVDPKILFNTEVEFEYGGQVNSATDDGELKIEQAWVDYMFTDAAVWRTGVVLVPFGRVNILHDSDIRETTNRPIYAKYVVPSTWMDVGTGFHGVFESGDWVFNYETYLINGLTTGTYGTKVRAIDGTNGIRNARPSFKIDNNGNKAIVGRLGVSPFLGLEVGGSYYNGIYNTDNSLGLSMLGTDLNWKHGPFEVLAEYVAIFISNGGSATIPAKMNGYYAEFRHYFFPEWLKETIFGASFANPKFALIGRIGGVDLNTAVSDGKDVTQYTIGVNYRPTDRFVAKLEYEINRAATGTGSENGNLIAASVAVGF